MQAIAWDLLTEFGRLGHRVTVLTTEIKGRADSFVETGVRVVPIVGARGERYSRNWWTGSKAYARGPECADVDGVISISTAAASLTALRNSVLRVPFLCQLHGTSWGEAVSKWRSRKWLERCKSVRNLYWVAKDATILGGFDELVVVGDTLRQQFRELPTRWITHGVPITVIRNGIDPRIFVFDAAKRRRLRDELGFSGETSVFVFCARLHPQKGGAESLRAVAQIRATGENAALLIIGSGPEDASLRRLAGSLGISDAVKFAGAIARAHIPGFLSAGDAFLFPTLRVEGLPMNVLEALAVGLPCVCAERLRDVFGVDDSLIYARPTDPAHLAEAMRRAIVMKRTGESLLPAGYSLRSCAQSYLDVLSRLRHR
jgi:glycosyltransferase involved in cell wall biosynthesis